MPSLTQLKPQELVTAITELVDEGATHFAVLGLDPSADPATVKQVFVRLARNLHPDLPAFKTPEDKSRATRAFQAATRAQMILSDPARRAEYLQELGVQPGAGAGAPEPNPDLARIHMHRARQLLGRRDWKGAEESLRLARLLFGEDVEDTCLVELGWAIFNNQDKSELERNAESKELWEAVVEGRGDPASVAQAHYYLAIWCKLNGEVPKVKKHLDNCLAIDDRHVDAKRELRLFERRRSSAQHRRPSTKQRRATGQRRASSARQVTGQHPKPTDTGPVGRPEVKKVPLKKKQSLLERLFGKS